MKTTRGFAAVLAAALLLSGHGALAQETAPLAVSALQEQEKQPEKLRAFSARRSYNGVEASSQWLYQARLGNRLLAMRLFTAEGEQITFQEKLCAAGTGEGDIRLVLRAGVRGEKLLLQLDQDAADTLDRLRITEIVVTDTDMLVQAEYLTDDLLTMRSLFGLGARELLCVSGEEEPVTVVSVDGVRRQITE